MRNIPTIVFVNKLDREGKDAFDLLDEIEQKLNLKVTPLSIPIGMGYDFRGIYNIWEGNIQIFKDEQKQNIGEKVTFNSLTDPELETVIGKKHLETLKEELELIEAVYPNFNKENYVEGKLNPVFFGSALNNFGVEELLNCFIEIAPEPLAKRF
jgi:peptide chain release factor 3